MYPHRCIFAFLAPVSRFDGQRESILRIISAAKSMLSRNAISHAGEVRCHARLAPSRILLCHLHDKVADALRKSWPTSFSLRLPFPGQLETLAMPANQRLWFDDDQGLFPIAEARPEDERETGGVVQSPRLDLPLLGIFLVAENPLSLHSQPNLLD
jgi:hypothetical protein